MKTSWRTSRRPLLEGILALVAGSLTLLALISPDWLEAFGIHGDYGSGAFEWTLPLAMALTAIALGIRAVRRWRIAFPG